MGAESAPNEAQEKLHGRSRNLGGSALTGAFDGPELHKLDATGRLLPVFAWADKPPRAAEATDAFRSLAESSKALCLLRAISLHFRKFRIIANARKRRAEWEPPRRWLRPN